MIVLLLLKASAKASQGQRPNHQMHPPLSHQALQPSAPMPLFWRLMSVIVLLLLSASAKASQGNGRGFKCTDSEPPCLGALGADSGECEGNVPDGAALKKLL